MVCLGFEPGPAGWYAQTKPRSYGGQPKTLQLCLCFAFQRKNLLLMLLSLYYLYFYEYKSD